MAVSAIISNFNGHRFLARLLETLRNQQGVELEIIVVDRHSRDESLAFLANQPDVQVVHEPPETGLVSGYAAGAAHATHEHLFFCNEDMWFAPDCLKLLERRIDLPRRVAAADPWEWTYDGNHWIHGGVRMRRSRFDLHCPYPFRAYLFTEPLQSGADIPFPCAGAFLIHRNVYDAIGGWDRAFFLDHEDVDLFIRAWQEGWRCVTVPEAKVYHAVNASNNQQLVRVKQRVGKRRYISGRASVPIIGLKYFTATAALLPLLTWGATLLNNLRRLRLELAWWDVLAAREVGQRLPDALRSRRLRSRTIQRRPGQQFFLEQAFNENA
jgi:GT2 family glycosyltransferase